MGPGVQQRPQKGMVGTNMGAGPSLMHRMPPSVGQQGQGGLPQPGQQGNRAVKRSSTSPGHQEVCLGFFLFSIRSTNVPLTTSYVS